MSEEPEVIAKLRFLHDGKVDWLTTECTTTGVTISAILAAYDGIRARLEEAEQQLRLLQKHTSAAYEEKRIVDLNRVAQYAATLEELVHKHGLRIPEWQPPAQPPRWAPAEDA